MLKQIKYSLKNTSPIIVLVITFLCILISGCDKPTPNSSIVLGGQIVNVELAQNPAQWEKGLSGHAPLQADQGMLFLFPEKRVQRFWMKSMLFPIDIIWLDSGRVAGYDKNLAPEGHEPANIYDSKIPVDQVLEVKAGTVDRLKIKTGDPIQYPI
jgi:uncharacterized protein